MRTTRAYPRCRRGVLLLIVMALLAMFAMMAVAFIVVTSQSRRSAEAFRDADDSQTSPREELERAFAQVIRGSNSPGSAMGSHSLLEDLYGNNAKLGQINDISYTLNTPDDQFRNEVWSTPETRLRGRNNRPLLEIAVRPANVSSQFAGSGAIDPRYNSVIFPPQLASTALVVGAKPIMPPLVMDARGTPTLGMVPTAAGPVADYGAVTECAGCVLTMLNGPAAGVSTRVVAVLPFEDKSSASGGQPSDIRPKVADRNNDAPLVARLQILAKDELNYRTLYNYFNPTGNVRLDRNPQTGRPLAPPLLYVINGAPFSGTGFGLPDHASGSLNQTAFLPNLRDIRRFVPGATVFSYNQPTADQVYPAPSTAGGASSSRIPTPFMGTAGGANEDYDAPDYQNMLLAMVRPPARVPRAIGQFPFDSVTTVPIPSMHRAELYTYWFLTQSAIQVPQVVQYVMRPMQSVMGNVSRSQATQNLIHPNFTGSNPRFNPAWDGRYIDQNRDGLCDYQWDVDNDGDGIPDSVWVDLGMPVRTLADGRRCKPLFAILCADLDGRLNLNAHGTSEHILPRNVTLNTAGVSARFAGYSASDTTEGASPDGRDYVDVQRGQGYGPAEVNLRAILPYNSTLALDPYVRLLRGVALPTAKDQLTNIKRISDAAQMEGRYGDLEYLLRLGATGNGGLVTTGDLAAIDYPVPGFPGERNPVVANRNANYMPMTGMGVYSNGVLQSLLPCPWSSAFTVASDYNTINGTYRLGVWRDAYGTPPNLNGNCAVALDRKGHPVYWGFAQGFGWRGDWERNTMNATRNYALNNPYELNLFQTMPRQLLPHIDAAWNTLAGPLTTYTATDLVQLRSVRFASDAPFTPGELERLLRPFDVDSSKLAGRILNLTDPQWPGVVMNPARCAYDSVSRLGLVDRRHEVTTESWDLPCPSTPAPDPTPSPLPLAYGGNPILRLLRQKMGSAASSVGPFLVQAYSLLAPETVAGLRMNLNRPFGNGRDDSNTPNGVVGMVGVVDEPLEGKPPKLASGTQPTASTEWQPYFNAALGPVSKPASATVNGNIDLANGNALVGAPGIWANGYFARELYARNLFCLGYILFNLKSTEAARIRELAQWAVNVVDFMDRDSIMSRFDYDPNPLNGWNPTHDGTNTVFGIERPELLITETLALHDRRAEDTDKAYYGAGSTVTDGKVADGADPEGTLDQYLRPQGSLFVELYNPNHPMEPGAVETGVCGGTNNGYIRLSAVSGTWPNDASANTSPVWRLVIAVPDRARLMSFYQNGQLVGPRGDTQNLVEWLRDQVAGTDGTWYHTERYVYFVNNANLQKLRNIDPTEAPTSKYQTTFYRGYSAAATAPDVNIPPGQYAVIGPGEPWEYTSSNRRSVTYLGFRNDDDTVPEGRVKTMLDPSLAGVQGYGGWRRIFLDEQASPQVVAIYNRPKQQTGATVKPKPGNDLDYSFNHPEAPQYKNVTLASMMINRGIPVVISQPRRLSITEPCDGYPEKPGGFEIEPVKKMYYRKQGSDKALPDFDAMPNLLDYDDTDSRKAMPGMYSAVRNNGTTERFRVVYLERLADPTRPFQGNPNNWNPSSTNPYNPYLPVDAMPVDLLAFNGTDRDPAAPAPGSAPAQFTAERGESYPPVLGGDRGRLLWGQEPLFDDPNDTQATQNRANWRQARSSLWEATPDASYYREFYFSNTLAHSLAHMSEAYGIPVPLTSGIRGFPFDDTTSFLGAITKSEKPTFPWLAWNNRPFVSQLELLYVPRANVNQLLAYPYADLDRPVPGGSYPSHFDVTKTDGNDMPVINPYGQAPLPPNSRVPNFDYSLTPFRHLPAFFFRDENNPTKALPYYRLLDYVHVPSRYVGAELPLPEAAMATFPSTQSALVATTHFFHTPQNWVSSYREPGRVNLNTLFSFDVWRGLNNDAQTTDGLITLARVENYYSTVATMFRTLDGALRNSGISIKGRTVRTAISSNVDAPADSHVNFDVMGMWRKLALTRKGYWSQAPGNWLEAADPRCNLNNNGRDSRDALLNPPPIPVSDGAVIDEMLAIDPAMPTRFANPFRSPAGAAFTPPEQRNRSSRNSVGVPLQTEVQATLLRPDPDSLFMVNNMPNNQQADAQPAGQANTQPMTTCLPLFGFYSRKNYNNAQRNPNFAYQTLQRLGNLATTRSNVYAVWITMGYFEAERITDQTANRYRLNPDPLVYPDGYMLGQEVGFDTGETRRYRGFYIFDRSIPVGFYRGQDVNFDKAVLVRRFIE